METGIVVRLVMRSVQLKNESTALNTVNNLTGRNPLRENENVLFLVHFILVNPITLLTQNQLMN